MPNIDTTVNQRIKARREELNMTQNELARLLGYSTRASITLIEKNKRDIPRSKIVAIAKALKTTPSYLMGWSDTVSSNQTSFASAIGKRIKDMRIHKGYTQQQLADIVGIPLDDLDDMESGIDRLFDVHLMYKFANALGVGTCYFMNDEMLPEVNVAENIKMLCEINYVSLHDFLNDIGIIEKTFNNYIETKHTVPFSIIEKTCDYFNISYNLFFSNDLTTIANKKDLRIDIRIKYITKKWLLDFDEYDISEEELSNIIDYTKYLVSKRK